MITPMRIRRVFLFSAIVLLLLVSLVGVFFKPLIRFAMRPGTSFEEAKRPAAPNYANPMAWSALPDREDVADVALPSLPAIDQRTASADVFYVHPTSYVGNLWNGPIDDPRLNADTDRVATKIQASAFNSCGAMYAPRYRQANGTVFIAPASAGKEASNAAYSDRQKALDIAYSDVLAAFQYYLQHHNHGRPFVLAAHSQGSVMAYRLLREEISGKPIRDKLVAAYLIGGAFTQEDIAHDLPDLPACATPEQIGCVIGWNARGPQYVPGEFEMVLPRLKATASPRSAVQLCVNPLTYRTDSELAGAEQNQGALFWDSASPAVMPGFASAVCRNGTLVVPTIGNPPRDFMSRILDRALGKQNYHPIEYQLFFVNLRHNAKLRVDAYLKQHASH